MWKHGSVNRAYRLVWNACRRAWVVAPETARGHGGSGERRSRCHVDQMPVRDGTCPLRREPLPTALAMLILMAMYGMPAIAQETPEVKVTGNVTPTPDQNPTASWDAGESEILTIGNTSTGTMEIMNGGKVTNTLGIIGFASTSTGMVTVSGKNSEWTNTSGLTVGHQGSGTLNITNGGKVTSYSGSIGNYSTAIVNVSGSNSQWLASGTLNVGYYGSGTLNITNEGTVTNITSNIGSNSTSTGTVTVSGAKSLWKSSDTLLVGYYGTGTLALADGGAASVNNGVGTVFIGSEPDSSGTLNIGAASGSSPVAPGQLQAATVRFGVGKGTLVFNHTGDDSLENPAHTFHAGIKGNGAIRQESGTTILTGDNSAFTGTTTVSGGTLRLTDNSKLGSASNGTITVSGGALEVDDNALTMAHTLNLNDGTITGGTLSSNGVFNLKAGTVKTALSGTANLIKQGTGTVILTGVNTYSGNTEIQHGALIIDGGTINSPASTEKDIKNQGSLKIENAGKVIMPAAIIYISDDSKATVSGKGSYWESKILYIGSTSEGSLRIEHGAKVKNSLYGWIGVSSLGVGDVIVSDAESSWTIQDSLQIGSYGNGTLQVKNGGTITAKIGSIGEDRDPTPSKGVVIISGANSLWENTNELSVGYYGDGTLTIADGGVASVNGGNGTVHIGRYVKKNYDIITEGSTGTLNIGAASGSSATAPGQLQAGKVEFGQGTGKLVFNHTAGSNADSPAHTFSASLSTATDNTSSSLLQESGTTILTGDSAAFTGTTNITGGTLVVNGNLGQSMVAIDSQGMLSGSGTVGSTTVQDGGRIAPGNSIGTLTVSGDLALSADAILDFELGSPGTSTDPVSGRSDRIVVSGDLDFNGTVNLTQSSAAGADGTVGLGYYRLITYGGDLKNNTASIGARPALANAQYTLQAGDKRVDLLISASGDDNGGGSGSTIPGDDTLQHWTGGSGTWSANGAQWINQDGNAPAPWAGKHAVFRNASGNNGGTITLQGAVPFQGIQFVDDGFRLQGPGSLVTHANGSEIRVLADRAEITAPITGAGGLRKTEAGTLILSGQNTYRGETMVESGTLAVHGAIADSAVTVQHGAILAGNGTVGSTTVHAGGRIAPGNSVGTLTVAGDLSLSDGAFLDIELGGPGAAAVSGAPAVSGRSGAAGGQSSSDTAATASAASNATPGRSDRIAVAGDLDFNGTVNLAQSDNPADGIAGLGYYRLITYGGALIGNTAVIGAKPALTGAERYELQAGKGRVDLFIGASGGGTDPDAPDDDTLQQWRGGSGSWNAEARQWLNADGKTLVAWAGKHAVFRDADGAARGGAISVDGTLAFQGIQFVDEGYRLAGSGQLVTAASGSEIRVLADQAEVATRIGGNGPLRKTGDGTLRLQGDSAGFTGTTTVARGTLAVDGRLGGALHVQAGARLQGNGILGDTTVAGTVAPGNSIGTLQVAGNLTLQPGSIYEAEVEPQATGSHIAGLLSDTVQMSDAIHVTGSATLQGGIVQVHNMPGSHALGSRHTLLTATGGVTGAFATLAQSQPLASPFLAFGLRYDTHAVHLDVGRSDVTFESVGRSRNQRAAGRGLDGMPLDNALLGAMAQQGVAAAQGALDQIAGDIHASIASALVEDSRFVRSAANDRLRAAQHAPGAPGMSEMAYGSADSTARSVNGIAAAASLADDAGAARRTNTSPTPVSATHAGPVFWSQGFGSWGRTDGDGNAARINRDSSGLLIGADGQLGDWRLGAMAGIGQVRIKSPQQSASGTSRNVHLGLYGGTAWGSLALRLGAAYTRHDIDSRRSVALPGFAAQHKADYRGGTLQAFGELGHGAELWGARVETYVNLAHVRTRTRHYAEPGDAGALAGQAKADTTFATLGVRGAHQVSLGRMDAHITAALAWRHVFGTVDPTATHRLPGGRDFTVAGAPIARNSAVIEAGLRLNLAAATSLDVSYTGQLASGARDHGVKANLAVRF